MSPRLSCTYHPLERAGAEGQEHSSSIPLLTPQSHTSGVQQDSSVQPHRAPGAGPQMSSNYYRISDSWARCQTHYCGCSSEVARAKTHRRVIREVRPEENETGRTVKSRDKKMGRARGSPDFWVSYPSPKASHPLGAIQIGAESCLGLSHN